MRICLGTYPIQLAKQMRQCFNAECRKRRKAKGQNFYYKMDNCLMKFRGRGKRKNVPGRNTRQDLPLRYADRYAVYLEILERGAIQ